MFSKQLIAAVQMPHLPTKNCGESTKSHHREHFLKHGCGSKPTVPFWGRCTTSLVYLSGEWDVHWGYDLDFDPHNTHLSADEHVLRAVRQLCPVEDLSGSSLCTGCWLRCQKLDLKGKSPRASRDPPPTTAPWISMGDTYNTGLESWKVVKTILERCAQTFV